MNGDPREASHSLDSAAVDADRLGSVLEPIEAWFTRGGWTPFGFQRATWHAYLRGESGLVHAPTGMGKTYAVWLGPLAECLDDRAKSPASGQPLRVLWLTPLRALANDTAENLRIAVEALAIPWTVGLRTGDTPQSVRARHRQRPPQTLITTPESLSVMHSYPGASDHFRELRCIIVDEWHELLGTKRGVQTELGLAHLRGLAPQSRTWGLSATLGNLDQAMEVLLGAPALAAGRGTLIRGDSPKKTIVDTLRPDSVERFPWSGHIGTQLLDQVIATIEAGAGATLLFTNVR